MARFRRRRSSRRLRGARVRSYKRGRRRSQKRIYQKVSRGGIRL